MERSTFIKLLSFSAVSAVTAHNFMPFDFPADKSGTTPQNVVDDLLVNIAGCNLHNELTRSDSEINQLCETKAVDISKDSSVVIVDIGQQKRAFQKVLSLFDNQTGAKLLAIREVSLQDALNYHQSECKVGLPPSNNELRILCSGLLNTKDIKINADQQCAFEVLQGRPSPQIYAIGSFAQHGELSKYLEDNKGLNVKVFGHSLGSSNALYLKHLLSTNSNVSACSAMLFEPFGVTQLAHKILISQPANIDQDSFISALAKDVVSIRSNPPTYVGRTYLSNAFGNKEFGQVSYALDYLSASDYRQPYLPGVTVGAIAGSALAIKFSPKLSEALYNTIVAIGDKTESYTALKGRIKRSRFLSEVLKVGVAGAAINSFAEIGGMAENMIFDDNHRMPLAFALARSGRDGVIVPCISQEVLATNEQVKNPDSVWRRFNGSVINKVASAVTFTSARF